MKELTKIAELLGEENEKKLKDSIVDLIIKQVESDLENYTDWIIDIENLHYEIDKEVEKIVKERVVEKYAKRVELEFYKMLERKFKE